MTRVWNNIQDMQNDMANPKIWDNITKLELLESYDFQLPPNLVYFSCKDVKINKLPQLPIGFKR